MYSKRKGAAPLAILATLAAALSVLASGCGRKGLPNSSGMSLGGSDTGCLSKFGAATARFFDGKASESETAAAWDCASRSLQLFEERTEGARDGVYTPQELRAFLEKYFLDGLKISDKLLSEAMELKRALIGGAAQELTLGDLHRARALFGVMREQSLRMRPYMPLTPQGLGSRGEAELGAGLRALAESAGSIGANLEDTGNPYAFAHLDDLVEELRKFWGLEPTPKLALLREHLAAIQAVKGALIAPEGECISGSEWSRLLATAARGYGLWLRFGYLDSRFDSWMLGPGRERMVALARDAFALVDEALAHQPREQLSFERIDALIDALAPRGVTLLGDRTVTAPHLKDFARTVVLRFMGGADFGNSGRGAGGLTRSAWARTRARFEHWSSGQSYLELLFQSGAHGQESGEFEGAKALNLASLFASPSDVASLASDAVARLRQIIAGDRPLFRGEANQIYFEGYETGVKYSLHGLSEANWMYELARILTSGYAEDPARADTADDRTQSVSFPEFSRFVNAIRDVGVDLKYIDPLDPKLPEKRFREAELFTFAGTGSDYMNTRQGAQLLALMLSGKRLANHIHQEAIDAGCRTGEMDPFDYLTIDAECYRRQFFGRIEHFWRNMPRLAAYYRSLSGAERERFEHDVEDGARKQGYSQNMMNSSDSEGFGMIGQYVEVVFGRFDKDNSGTLDWNEAGEAFPVFRGALKEISCMQGHCLTSEGDLKAVFTYMLAHGKAPSPLAFVRWRYFPFFRRLAADRGTLMEIFAQLGKPSPH